MDFMGKKLEDIVVTLPYADGTSVDCGVFSYFEVNHKKIFCITSTERGKTVGFCSKLYAL